MAAAVALSLSGDMIGSAHIDEGFLDNLENGVEMKPVPSNSVRTQHGDIELDIPPKMASREVMLPFVFSGANARSDCRSFVGGIESAGLVDITANGTTYHLRYLGKSNTYKSYAKGTIVKINLRFKEANPSNRS